jgi:hypothetical protein
MRFKTKDGVASSGSTFTWTGRLYWLTSDSAEKNVWDGSGAVRTHVTAVPSDYNISDFNSLSENWQTVNWDMKSAAKPEWDDRIITALRIQLFHGTDTTGPMIIDTDIDYIKISANTSG